MKVYLETMGCQMNRLDSELVEGLLRAAGHEMVAERRLADVVLYNTCTVRRHAEDKVFSRLGADGQRKKAGKRLIVGVLGCVAQGQGERLRKRYPQVDIVCGPGQIHRLPQLIEQVAGIRGHGMRGHHTHLRQMSMVSPDSPSRTVSECRAAIALDAGRTDRAADEQSAAALEEVEVRRDPAVAPGRSQAFVRVMRGCDRFCTYCVVPFVRGPERSRPPERIVEEVRRLVGAGRSEITLLGQTVNSYHYPGTPYSSQRDEYGVPIPGVHFSDLLARVSAVPGLRRLRFVTSHPLDFGDDILAAMRDLPNVCPYIHCPAQSGSDGVLKRMKRGYTRAQYDDLVDRARAIVPGVVLSGDFIVGFPGETESDHEASADLLRRSGYKNSFIFKYSPRPGTLAARKYADDVPEAVKKRRNNELLAVQREVGLAHHRRYVGRTVEVLVEGSSPRAARGGKRTVPRQTAPMYSPLSSTQLVGRTTGDHIVVFDGPAELADRYVRVEISGATSLTLMGALKATHVECDANGAALAPPPEGKAATPPHSG